MLTTNSIKLIVVVKLLTYGLSMAKLLNSDQLVMFTIVLKF